MCTGSLHIGTEIGTEKEKKTERERERAKFNDEYWTKFLVLFIDDDRIYTGEHLKQGDKQKKNMFYPTRILSRWHEEFSLF